MNNKNLPNISIKKGQWVCKDTIGLIGIGSTPKDAWIKYHSKVIDKLIKKVLY